MLEPSVLEASNLESLPCPEDGVAAAHADEAPTGREAADAPEQGIEPDDRFTGHGRDAAALHGDHRLHRPPEVGDTAHARCEECRAEHALDARAVLQPRGVQREQQRELGIDPELGEGARSQRVRSRGALAGLCPALLRECKDGQACEHDQGEHCGGRDDRQPAMLPPRERVRALDCAGLLVASLPREHGLGEDVVEDLVP